MELRSRFADELGVEPGDETLHLVAQLRAEREFERRDVAARHPPRLVGRLTERGRLVALAGRCIEGHGGMAVVLGDAGMGKTRLLDELAAAAGLAGRPGEPGHAATSATCSRLAAHSSTR